MPSPGVSATQREAIARAAEDAAEAAIASDDAYASIGDAVADAVLGVVAGLVDEARRDERERIKAGIEALPETGQWGDYQDAIDAALKVVDESEAT